MPGCDGVHETREKQLKIKGTIDDAPSSAATVVKTGSEEMGREFIEQHHAKHYAVFSYTGTFITVILSVLLK